MALRLSDTLAGSTAPSSAARAAKPNASIVATSAITIKSRIFPTPELRRLLQLAEAPLRINRAKLGGALIPAARLCRIRSDVAGILRSEHGRIVGLRHHQSGTGLAGLRGPFQQETGRSNIAGLEQRLAARHQVGEFVGVEASDRRCNRGGGCRGCGHRS